MPRRVISLLLTSTALLLGCNSTDSSGEFGSDSDNATGFALPGSLYYQSRSIGGVEEAGLVEYDPQTYTQDLLISQEGIKQFAISSDGLYLAAISKSQTELVAFNRYDYDDVLVMEANEKYKLPLRFSPNASKLAYRVDYYAVNSIRIRSKDGEQHEITREELEPLTDRPPLGWDWLTDNSLVFSSGSTIYKVEDISGREFTKIIDFPDSVDIGNIAISNDRKKVAFTQSAVHQNDQAGNAFVMNIDGTEVKQLTKDRVVRDIAWSPDDKYVAFITGLRSAGGENFPDKCTRIYAVDISISEPASISLDTNGPAIMLKHVTENGLEDLCISARSSLYWIEK